MHVTDGHDLPTAAVDGGQVGVRFIKERLNYHRARSGMSFDSVLACRRHCNTVITYMCVMLLLQF